jgi:hypothetical protein
MYVCIEFWHLTFVWILIELWWVQWKKKDGCIWLNKHHVWNAQIEL